MSEPSSYKSTGGLIRIAQAAQYSWQGLQAAVRHEAAFRQELLIGLPLIVAAPFLGPSGVVIICVRFCGPGLNLARGENKPPRVCNASLLSFGSSELFARLAENSRNLVVEVHCRNRLKW